ncbi:MAG: MFS transporter [Anaerolineales bacterium]|nr:MFS transporter [Anaerolineales bacterium]
MSEEQELKESKRRINAWCMYDWANSAFATTILAAVLPIYYSQVAGAYLPSEAVATAYWSIGLSISLFIVALISPIMGTVSDVMRGKKRFLSIFAGAGIVGTGLLVLVSTGDWLLASILFIVGRIGFTGANVFYDALLPHVAKEEEQDWVSTRGYAMGYLGGGLLLAVNVVMIQFLPGTWGSRLSFLSVAIWWAIFTIPLLRRVPEPASATVKLAPGENVVSISFKRLGKTLKNIRKYRYLFQYLIAFFIYNDGIGTIIGVAAIYGAELGFGTVDMVLALLLVQFAGIPFSLIFGRLPNKNEKRRPFFMAFIVFNMIALPLTGLVGARTLPDTLTGAPQPAYQSTQTAIGEGSYYPTDNAIDLQGTWQRVTIPADEAGLDIDVAYAVTGQENASYNLAFNGQQVKVTYSMGPDRGIWAIKIDGEPLLERNRTPIQIDGYHKTVRYGVNETFSAEKPGSHILTLVNTGERHVEGTNTLMTLAQAEVLPPIRTSNLGAIIGIIIGVQIIGAVFALTLGRSLFSRLVDVMDTKRSIMLALLIYSVIAIWGFVLDSVLEFWLLAWMVSMVQGGSQALSRSLYASLSPASKSGEFFGFYGVMEKFSAIIGPLIFAGAATVFNNSRPAVLSLVVLFVIGLVLLIKVDVDKGRQIARQEDAELTSGEIVGK